jgi:hypothetical protein
MTAGALTINHENVPEYRAAKVTERPYAQSDGWPLFNIRGSVLWGGTFIIGGDPDWMAV